MSTSKVHGSKASSEPRQLIEKKSNVNVIVDPGVHVSKKQAAKIAAVARAAYKRDAFNEGTAPKKGRLNVAILNARDLAGFAGKEAFGGFGVLEDGTPLVAVGADAAKNLPNNESILAHELGHELDSQAAPGKSIDAIPRYLQEGKEVLLGDAFDRQSHVLHGNQAAVKATAEALKTTTAKDARALFAHPSTQPNEALSALYVEFLRTKLGGSGKPDALPRLAALTAQAGKDKSFNFEQAFQASFGVSPSEAQADFIRDTYPASGKVALSGIYAQALAAKPPPQPAGKVIISG